MKNSKFLPIIFALVVLMGCLSVPAAAVDRPTVTAKSALVIDRSSGEILYSKDEDRRVDPADLAKLMTALVAVEAVEAGKVSLNDMVTVTDAMNDGLGDTANVCGLQIGEQITLGALLQCTLVAAADDAANVVADYVGGGIKDFVARMNERAAALGCKDTRFANAHGGYDPSCYSTASDFCRIGLECLRHERIKRICGTVVAEVNETNLSPARTLRNVNALICDESVYGDYTDEDCDGLMAGYNEQAGYTLLATAGRDGVDLLCAVFGGVKTEADRYTCFVDARALFDWVFDTYAYQEVLKSTENIASVDVALGMNATYVNLRPATSITVLLPKNFTADDFEKDIRVYAIENGEPVTAPVTAGQVLGEVTLMRSGVSYGTVKLVASASVQLSRVQYIKQQVQETTRQRNFRIAVAVLAVLFLLYLIWVAVYRVKHLKHLYAVRAAQRERERLIEEAAMKHAPEPKSPAIRFFNERGQTSAPEPLPQPQKASESEAPEREPPDAKIVALFQKGTKPKPESPAPSPAPVQPPKSRLPEDAPIDLLADAVLVAKLAPPPPPREESAEEKAERDYFEEFFRPKK